MPGVCAGKYVGDGRVAGWGRKERVVGWKMWNGAESSKRRWIARQNVDGRGNMNPRCEAHRRQEEEDGLTKDVEQPK